ncbi:sensor histidine kinase [Haloarcula regularis]|uniref:sensor histidine kinase n=1 Tax=Haloarcula regularis TaxID=3033392 RepID=UPI0023E7774C|nr:HAMP domain-containing sensor histidine kinase [Halomicroarcula sp. SYNS111]
MPNLIGGRQALYGGILAHLVLGTIHLLFHAHETVFQSLFEVSILIGIPAAMLGFLHQRNEDFTSDTDYWRGAIGGSLGMSVAFTLYGLHLLDSRLSPDVTMEVLTAADAAFILLMAANTGGVAGLLFGWQQVRVRKRAGQVERAKAAAELSNRHEQRLLFLNRILRHHVLNGLTVILGAVEGLKDGSPRNRQRSIELIENRSERMAEYVEDIRSVVTTLAGEIPITNVKLAEVLEEEVSVARRIFPEAEFDVNVPDEMYVRGNELTGVVFENLLENAVKHNDSDTPRVWSDVTEDEDAVRVSIADNGPGISDEYKTGYFERGEHGQDSLGEGLGLYLAETTMSLSDGDIWIEDNEPRGTRVILEFRKADRDIAHGDGASGQRKTGADLTEPPTE